MMEPSQESNIPTENKRKGYSRLASLMGAHPSVAIFQRFTTLNSLTLLHLQAELKTLEVELLEQAKIDAESLGMENIYDRHWETLRESLVDGDCDPSQWQILQKIKEKLREYNETLVLQHTISKLSSPSEQNLRFLKTWMEIPSMGNVWLLGPDRDLWEKSPISQLLCIEPQKSDSWFDRYLTDVLVRRYHHAIGWRLKSPDDSEFHGNTVHYSQERLSYLASMLSMALSVLLPVMSVVILYLVTNMTLRLVIVGTGGLAFALGLRLFTNARKIEAFTATTTFTAMLAVFLASPIVKTAD